VTAMEVESLAGLDENSQFFRVCMKWDDAKWILIFFLTYLNLLWIEFQISFPFLTFVDNKTTSGTGKKTIWAIEKADWENKENAPKNGWRRWTY
jgi:hypothetical protein